jgi:hypothetical protein
MAFVVPIVAAFSAISTAGGVIAAMSTLSGFLTVAGGVLAGVGALTGKKDLVKLGSIMSLGGALGNAFGQGAAEAAGEVGVGEVVDATGGMDTAVESVANTGIGGAAGAVPTTPGTLGPQTPTVDVDQMATAADASQGAVTQTPLMQKAASVVPEAPGSLAQQYSTDAVSKAAEGLTSNDISSWLSKANKGMAGVGDFMKQNPELVKVGGEMLSGMYGPEAEQNDLQRQINEQNQSLLERARRNLNTPISLKYRTGA